MNYSSCYIRKRTEIQTDMTKLTGEFLQIYVTVTQKTDRGTGCAVVN